MGGKITISRTVRSSFGLYSDTEKAAVKNLYRHTNKHSKEALFSTAKTTEEQERRLLELTRLVDLIADQNNTEETLELNAVRELIEKLDEQNQRILRAVPRTERQLEKRSWALQDLLAKEEEVAKAEAIRKHREEREKLLLNTKDLAKQRDRLPTMLAYYQQELARTNPASFRFMTEEQKLQLENKLLYTYLLLYSQYQLDVAEGRAYTASSHQEALDLCSKRIEELRSQPLRGEKLDFQEDLDQEISHFTKALKFLGITILAAWVVEKIMQFAGKKTAIKDWISEVNGKRLYWVWGGGMLSSILEFLPKDFHSASVASDRLAAPSRVTGYMSFVLYYCRLGINLFLLFKHTINGPWMSKEESKIPAWERFTTQWDQRKFAILNDLFWAPINMVCFFWLRGSGTLGYAGNVVTFLLLAMDLAFTLWRHWEESTKHNKEMEKLRQDRSVLRRKIQQQEKLLASAESDEMRAVYEAKIAELRVEEKRLQKVEAKAKFDWKYKQLGLINDCCYAFGLLLSFSIVICFFFPPATLAPATVMIMGLCGAVACFLATAIYTGINCYLERAKTQEQSQIIKAECAELLKAFKREVDPQRKKQLYLEMKTLMAESDYQHRLAKHQLIKTFVSILIDAAFPAVVFTTIVFAPVGLSIGAIVGIIASVMLVSWYFNNIILKNVEPQPHDLPEFNEQEYEELAEAVEDDPRASLDDLSEYLVPQEKDKSGTSRDRFFDYNGADGEALDDDEELPLLGMSGSGGSFL